MNKFEYGQRVLHNKTDLAMIVGQDNESTYKIIPDGDYEWVYADADRLEPVSAWIPCSERMPEDGVDVLVSNGNYIKMALLNYVGGKDGCFWISTAGDFTHWMPLPAIPEGKAE